MELPNAFPAIEATGFYSGQLRRNYIPAIERGLFFSRLQVFVEGNCFSSLHLSFVLGDFYIALWYLLLVYNEVYKYWRLDGFFQTAT